MTTTITIDNNIFTIDDFFVTTTVDVIKNDNDQINETETMQLIQSIVDNYNAKKQWLPVETTELLVSEYDDYRERIILQANIL